MSTAVQESVATMKSWRQSNQAYLELELERLRLLLHRRIAWLRSRWQHDPLAGFQTTVISEEQADALLAGEDPAGEALFYQENPDAAMISRRITELSENLEALRNSWSDPSELPAFERLTRLFGLGDFERRTLLLCLAPELDPAFERLYAYVQDDVTRKYPTLHLALTLFAGDVAKWDTAPWIARDVLGASAPLRHYRLVELEATSGSAAALGQALRLDERMVDYLRGLNRLDERLDGLLRPAPAALLASAQQQLVARLVRAQTGPPSEGRTPINLLGPRGAGKQAVARALSDEMGLPLFLVDARKLALPLPELQDHLRLLEREMLLLQSALYLDGMEVATGNPTFEAMTELVDRLGTFFVVGTEDRWPTERELTVVKVEKPDAEAQRELWQQALSGRAQELNGQVDALVEQFDLGPRAVAGAVALAIGQGSLSPAGGLTPEGLWQACRLVAGKSLDGLAQRIVPRSTWDDIVLPEKTHSQLRELATQVAHRFQVYETWGFGTKLSRGRGVSALFAGPSGTGKTMAAEVLAHHLNLDLYRIDLAGVVSKYIGETEKNLRRVFDAAEEAGAILFFDEADALFGKRTEVKDSHDRYANIEVNYLLQRMEDYRGLAVLATNRKNALDRAFLRRLRFLVDFPAPDADSRLEIWRRVFPPEAAIDALEVDGLARLEIAGGNIKNIAINAAFLAAGEQMPIGMGHVMRAARREYAKIDKLVNEREFGAYYKGGRS